MELGMIHGSRFWGGSVQRYNRDNDMIENTGEARRQSFHSPTFYPPSASAYFFGLVAGQLDITPHRAYHNELRVWQMVFSVIDHLWRNGPITKLLSLLIYLAQELLCPLKSLYSSLYLICSRR